MNKRNRSYTLDGWRVLIRPGRWLPCRIYFTVTGKLFHVGGLDLYAPDHTDFLGWVPGHNISEETYDSMIDFIKKHRPDWRDDKETTNQPDLFD